MCQSWEVIEQVIENTVAGLSQIHLHKGGEEGLKKFMKSMKKF